MSKNLTSLAQSFLNEMSQSKESIDLLRGFLNELEEKNDPNSDEIKLVSDIYQFFEKMDLLKNNLNNYIIKEYNRNNAGSKLDELLTERNKFSSLF